MKKLQKYVLAETGKALVPAFCALLLIMMVGFCMQLLHEGLDVVRLHRLLPPLVAYCVPMVLPSAFLTAVIMAFGRLSADNELIAVRAAGIHLSTIVFPVLLAGLALSGLVAYFQFELVPRARGTIETLKYNALKQILLDKASLSARRQFSFGPFAIQYDDFVRGKLVNLMVLEMAGRRPRRIVTASSAVVSPHSEKPELVQFELEAPNITQFGFGQYGGTVTTSGKQYILFVPVAREESRILSDEKHLAALDLLARRHDLKTRVAEQEQYDEPRRVRQERGEELRLLNLQVADVQGDLDKRREDLQKYGEQLPRQATEIVGNNAQRMTEINQQIEALRAQMGECMVKITEVREAEEPHVDYDRLGELEKQLEQLRSKTDTHKSDVEKLAAEADQARQNLANWEQRATQIKGEMDVLDAQKQRLLSMREDLTRTVSWARDQCELMSVDLRVHKRATQAVSLLVFALIGIPAGIVAGRRSIMIAFGISFAIVLLVFYPFLIFGQIAAKSGTLPIVPAMWAGNVFVGLIGLASMTRVMTR